VIARRNDRHRDVDNGTRGTVTALDLATGALTIDTDHGGRRELDATYAAEHLEYAYALTGHGAQGATVEWAGVTGRPGDFSAEWPYTALSRARGHTRLHVSAEPTANQREREQYAPPSPRAPATKRSERPARRCNDTPPSASRSNRSSPRSSQPSTPRPPCHSLRSPRRAQNGPPQ